jgi:hypothetical protein
MADFGTHVFDGAVDPARFECAPKRIVWLLREVNDPAGNLTDIRGNLRRFADKRYISPPWKPTFGPVARVSYGLLNPTDPWERWCDNVEEFSTALGQIAVVNVKKIAGGAIAKWAELKAAFKAHEPELRAQLDALSPQIVIGGNVMSLCRNWLGGWPPPAVAKSGPYLARRVGDATWVHANHPNYRGGYRSYFDRIRDGIALASAP